MRAFIFTLRTLLLSLIFWLPLAQASPNPVQIQERYPDGLILDQNPMLASFKFGRQVAVDGEWAVVSELGLTTVPFANPRNQSILHFYRRDAIGFHHAQTLLPDVDFPYSGHPRHLEIVGETVLLATRNSAYNDGTGFNIIVNPHALVFEFDGVSWRQTQQLFPEGWGSISAPDRNFAWYGAALLSEDSIVVPMLTRLDIGTVSTVIQLNYMYRKTAGVWRVEQVLRRPSVPVSPIGLFINGNIDQLVYALKYGGFYLAERDSSGAWSWTETHLMPQFTQSYCFGENMSVAVEGDLVAVGVPLRDSVALCPLDMGMVRVFRRANGIWVHETDLQASDGSGVFNGLHFYNDQFGFSVDIDEGRILVGATHARPGLNVNTPLGEGQAYVFEHIGGQWQETYRLRGADVPTVWGGFEFGNSVALDGDTAVVAAWRSGLSGEEAGGAVEVFNLPMHTSVCQGTPNSTQGRGQLEATGWRVISLGDLKLQASGLPPGQTALFLAARQSSSVPNPGGSQGTLCLGGSQVARFNRPGEVGSSDAAGLISLTVTTQDVPFAQTVPMLAGETWFFQCWYRDQNPMPTSNFTEAIEATWN